MGEPSAAGSVAGAGARSGEMGLGRRTVSGGLWLLGQRLAVQLLAVAQTVILARLLAPRDLGVMGIALLAVRYGEVFTYTGYDYALVQKVDLSEADLHTAWAIMLGRRLLLAVGLFLLAAPLGGLFHEPEATPLLRALSLAQVMGGLSSLGPILALRELAYARFVAASLPALAIGFAVSVGLAFAWRNAWALACGYLAQTAAMCALSYCVHPHRPRLRVDVAAARQLTGYGRWMLASAVLNLVVTQGSDTACAWMFGPAALGLYQMASRFAFLPATQIGEVAASAALPSYARIQREPARLRGAFLRVLGLTAFVVLPLSVLIMGLGPALVGPVLGAKWLDAAPLLPVIAVAGLLAALQRTGTPLFLATGRPRAQFLMDGAGAAVVASLFYPLGRAFGPWGLGVAAALGGVAGLAVCCGGIRRWLGCGATELGRALLPPLCGAAAMLAILWASGAPAGAAPTIAAGVPAIALRAVVAGAAYLAALSACARLLGSANSAREALALAKEAALGLWPRASR